MEAILCRRNDKPESGEWLVDGMAYLGMCDRLGTQMLVEDRAWERGYVYVGTVHASVICVTNCSEMHVLLHC